LEADADADTPLGLEADAVGVVGGLERVGDRDG
jgi:hypothetical protein